MKVVLRDNYTHIIGRGDITLDDIFYLMNRVGWQYMISVDSRDMEYKDSLRIDIDEDDVVVLKQAVDDGKINFEFDNSYHITDTEE